MASIEWNNNLSVGIQLIDSQHKELIERLNALSVAVDSGQAVAKVVNTLTFLIEYTEYHFSAEEEHMKSHGYPSLESHHAQHEEFKKILGDLLLDFEEEGATYDLAASTNTLMARWLVDHIQGVDVKFGAFLKEKNVVLE